MVSFIDDLNYDIIASQLKKLHINEQMYPSSYRLLLQQKQKMQEGIKSKLLQFKESLRQIFSRNKPHLVNYYIIQKKLETKQEISHNHLFNQNHNEIQYYANQYKINFMYSIYSKLIIKTDPCIIKIRTTLLKNGVHLQIKSKAFRLLISRFFTKLNSNRRDGLFKLNPFNGLVYFDLSSMVSLQQFYRFIFDNKLGLQYIESELRQSTQQAKKYLVHVLQIIQEIVPDSQQLLGIDPLRKIVRVENQLDLIKKCINYCTFEYQFMYHNIIRGNLSQTDIKNRILIGKQKFIQNFNTNFTITMRTDYLKVTKILQYYNRETSTSFQSIPYTVSVTQLKEFQKQFIKNLIYPNTRINITNQRMNIFNQIIIVNNEKLKWDQIAEGGFSKIQKGQIQFTYSEIVNNANKEGNMSSEQIEKFIQSHSVKKALIKKTDKTSISKIPQEKCILMTIKQLYSHNIGKFYQSHQPEFLKDLFIDYYAFKSLDCYRKSWQSTFSLLTKLYIIMQAVQGIRFLSDNKIIHLDLKPLNLLIGRNLTLKISDFGQSYHPNTRNIDYRPGYTIPYCSPQIFGEGNIPYNQKIDVFGMGIIMYEILFDFFPLDIRRVSTQKLISFYRENKFEHLILSNPEKIDGFGPSNIIILLSTLCLKCLSKNPDERPLLDWIQIIIKQCIVYLDQIY